MNRKLKKLKYWKKKYNFLISFRNNYGKNLKDDILLTRIFDLVCEIGDYMQKIQYKYEDDLYEKRLEKALTKKQKPKSMLLDKLKIQCNKCKTVIEVPHGSCTICFSEHIGDILEHKESAGLGKNEISIDFDVVLDNLSIFINELTNFDYERGLHNAKCENELSPEGINLDWTRL